MKTSPDKNIMPLIEGLDKALEIIQREQPDRRSAAIQSLALANETLKKMEIGDHRFKNKAEEILYFKYLWPNVYSTVFYYRMIVNAFSSEPLTSRKGLILFYKNLQDNCERFRESNQELIDYCRSGYTHLDGAYFTRDTWADHPDDTHPACRWGSFLAHERFYAFAAEQIQQLKKNTEDNKLIWTTSKTSLIELLYALHAARVFNDGKADLKQIAQALEKSFQVSLGNYYRVFQDIRLRKISQTVFLDALKEKLMSHVRDLE